MKYGHFDDKAREYVIDTPRTPYPWINYLGCEQFFGIISNTAGGYCFYRDARLRRVTRYRYNNMPVDNGGRYFYIKDGDTVWNPGWKPVKTELDSYSCRHGMGYTIFEAQKDGIAAEMTFLVPGDENCEVQRVRLTNNSGENRAFRFTAAVEWCLWNAVDDSTNFQRNLNIGELVLQGLETNDQMGWVFVDDAQTALDGVNAGDYYAALILPPEFTGDFVSILEGDLRHPEIQYYENEKKNAIAPKITGKAKTAVQEEINTTILEKVADALTTAGSVFKAMGLDGQDVANDLLEKLSSAQQDMDQMAEVFRSLQNVMEGASSLLAASAITISDAQSTMNSTSAAVGSTVQLIDTGLDAADDTSDDLLQVLNTADAVLSELEDMLNGVDLTPAEDIAHEKAIAQIDRVIAALQRVCSRTDDAVLVDRLEAAIDQLETLKSAVEQSGLSHVQDELRQVIGEVRELLRTAAVKTNQQVNAYIHRAGERAQSTLGSVQEILTASSGALGGVSSTLRSYSNAVSAAQPTLAASVTLAESVSGYLADIEEDVRRITDSAAFKRFVELMASDSDSMAAYLASPVQMNTQIIYEIKDYGAAMSPYYVMLALFVGSLLTAVMVKVPVTQPKFQQCRAVERYFGRFMIFFFMAIAQALVTAFGCLHFVGMEAAEPALFVLACCICSLNFSFMNYALVYSLDNVGLALSVIIMVLQVAGSGGSYPIDVLPALFRSLYPFMPFHYGMDMIRETIGGMYGQTYLHCALLLLGMCVLFTVFGLLVYYPARKLNAAIAASKEKSGIM